MNISNFSNILAYIIVPIWFISFIIYIFNPSTKMENVSILWGFPLAIWYIVMILDFSNTVRNNGKQEAALVLEYRKIYGKREII